MTTQALIPVDSDRFPALAGDAGIELINTLAEIADGAITWRDFTRVGMPTGGSLKWTVPGLGGETTVDVLEGVIIASKTVRGYWEGNTPRKGMPPDCASDDALVGSGMYGPGSEANPKGTCRTCPMAPIGAGCKQRRLVFLLREGDSLPIIVNVSPGSLGAIKDYFFAIVGKRLSPVQLVTRFTLHKASSRDGIEYAQIEAQAVGMLAPEQAQAARTMGEQLRMLIDEVSAPVAFDD